MEIKADRLLRWYSKLTGTGGRAKMGAFWPFIFTTSNISPKLRTVMLNHERIHLAQQREKLLLGQWLVYLLENIWYLVFKSHTPGETYLLQASEKEAYTHMFDLNYLSSRPAYADIRFHLSSPPVNMEWVYTQYLHLEGLKHVYRWTDAPSTIYPPHRHRGRVVLFILDGSVTFSGDLKMTANKFTRVDVPPGVLHSAQVGEQGCVYLVGQDYKSD